MKNENAHESGAIFVEACIVIPLLMVFILVFVYIINLFIVHSYVQYGLNQTVNEVGSYTYYLQTLGIIDWDKKTKAELNNATEEGWDDIEQFGQTYSDVMDAVGSVQDTAENVGELGDKLSYEEMQALVVGLSDTKTQIEETKDKVETAGSSLKQSWGIVQKYLKDPSKLLMFLKNQGIKEFDSVIHAVLGALIGKGMMYRYVDAKLLEGMGVVGIDYNGKKADGTYNVGIDGMCFWQSSLLNDTDSRIIRMNVMYRVKFPVNLTKFVPHITKDNPIYENSFCIEQEAIGYGWIGGDYTGNRNKSTGEHLEYHPERQKTEK